MNKKPPSVGSAYWLLKQKAGDLSLQRCDTEAELREHMDAMWRFTDWHVVAVGIRPNVDCCL